MEPSSSSQGIPSPQASNLNNSWNQDSTPLGQTDGKIVKFGTALTNNKRSDTDPSLQTPEKYFEEKDVQSFLARKELLNNNVYFYVKISKNDIVKYLIEKGDSPGLLKINGKNYVDFPSAAKGIFNDSNLGIV